MKRRFIQCDVFSKIPGKGNALAVVLDAEGLTTEEMQSFAAWTNLAETTFLLPPSDPNADYRVRIFTTVREMLFAGHPTLGSCMSWLHAGGTPKQSGLVRQECAIGLVDIDVSGDIPAFVAPDTKITEMPTEGRHVRQTAMGLSDDEIKTVTHLDNGPEWYVFELHSAEAVLAVDSSATTWPTHAGTALIGAHPDGSEGEYEVRNMAPSSGMSEDPITGSLNSAIAKWLDHEGRLEGQTLVSQGTNLNREGRVHITKDAEKIWIGGAVNIIIEGTVDL